MALLAYSLGYDTKREINQRFTVTNAKRLACAVVAVLLLCHAASRCYGGELRRNGAKPDPPAAAPVMAERGW